MFDFQIEDVPLELSEVVTKELMQFAWTCCLQIQGKVHFLVEEFSRTSWHPTSSWLPRFERKTYWFSRDLSANTWSYKSLRRYILHGKSTSAISSVIWQWFDNMSSPATAFLVLFFFCFVAFGSCGTPKVNGTTIIWNDNFEDGSKEGSDLKTKYDAKGLQPWYNFANSFIGTVLSKDPYGE